MENVEKVETVEVGREDNALVEEKALEDMALGNFDAIFSSTEKTNTKFRNIKIKLS